MRVAPGDAKRNGFEPTHQAEPRPGVVASGQVAARVGAVPRGTAALSRLREPNACMLRLMVVRRPVALLALLPLLAACGGSMGSRGTAESRAAPPSSVTPSVTTQAPRSVRTGPVEPDGAAASCVEGYSPRTLKNRDFAFDGTIV